MNISVKLLAFAKNREKAYQIKKRFDATRAAAITQIRKVAGYISGKPPLVQLKYVTHIEAELMALLPEPDSKFKGLRNEILELLDRAKS